MSNDLNTPNGADPAPETGDVLSPPDGRIAELEAERTDLKDKLLRTLADMENLRRRTEREVTDARLYAVTGFARDLLTVSDNLRRALDSLPADIGQDAKPFIEGVELTEKDLLKTLERHGVKRLEPMGSKFDPNMHQAMFEMPSEDVASGTVVQVVQTGYAIGERVLRPAMVGVARNTGSAAGGAAKSAAAASPEGPDSGL